MCGRFTLSSPADVVEDVFGLAETPSLTPRFNIAPTQQVAAVVAGPTAPVRRLERFRWGLVPSWAKDPSIGNRMINARSETAATKPSFRAAFKRRRCLVVADGFYEWRKVEGEKRKQPVLIRAADCGPFGMAGLWEVWRKGPGEPLESCTILTTSPNELLAEVHDRMPVILPSEEFATWLDPQLEDRERLQELMRAYPADRMRYHPVSTTVNNVRNDEPRCVEPLEIQGDLFG